MRNKKVYSVAIRAALRVDFLETSEEIFMYAGVIYQAMMWGMKPDAECETE